jgi:hypothetical protein
MTNERATVSARQTLECLWKRFKVCFVNIRNRTVNGLCPFSGRICMQKEDE